MASLPYPRCPPNSFHRTHSKFVCASPPTEFTEFTEISGGGYSPTDFTEYTEASGVEEPPTDFTDVHRFFFSASRFCVFREFCGKIVLWQRGYGIPAIPTLPSEFLPQNPLQVCLRKSSHRIHRSFRRRIFSHRLHRIHRSFWRRIASHRCAQMHTDG